MKEKYELNKMSKPGFTLTSNHISIIVQILDDGICNDCKLGDNLVHNMDYYDELIMNRKKLYVQHNGFITLKKDGELELDRLNRLILNELLSTSCGAEYWFSINNINGDDLNADDLNAEYQAQLVEDIEEYNKLIKGGISAKI